MKVATRQILPKVGFDVACDPGEPWLSAILDNLFPDRNVERGSITGTVHLEDLTGTIVVSGTVSFIHRERCARCGAELAQRTDVPVRASLIPRSAIGGDEPVTEEEEKQLTPDDLNLAFYDGEEVEIGPVVNDAIALALPYNYYCADRTACDKAWAAMRMRFGGEDADPRWDALKAWRPKN